MPVVSTPAMAQSIAVGAVRISPADLSNLKTVFVAGANGSLIDFISASTDDTSAKDLQFWVSTPTYLVAQAILTSNGTNVSNNDTVTIDTKTYTFQNTLTNVDGNVKIAASAALSLVNLFNAINLGGGVPGTDFAAAMTPHPTVLAAGYTTTTLTVTATATGTAGNSIVSTKVATTLTWSASTLLGGLPAFNFDFLLTTVNCPAQAGFGTNSLISVLDNTRFGSNAAPFGLQITDPNGNKLLRLAAGEILKVKSLTTVTIGRSVYIRASGANL